MAGKIRGITIELGADTSQFTSELGNANKAINDTQKQLKDVDKLLKLDPKNTELLAQKQRLLGDQIGKTKDKLKILQDQQKTLDDTIKNGGEVDQATYDALQREIISTKTEMNKLEEAAKKVHVPTELQAELSKISDAAGKVADKTKALSTGAAVAAGGMIAMAGKAAATADDLLTMSNVTGFTVEELQKMQYASSFIDVSFETMTGSITKLTKNMESGNAAFDTLGISVTNADGTMRSATEVWYETIAALGQVANETERDQLSMDLFGKSAMEMAGVVDDGGQALKDLGADAEATGNILSGDAVADAVAFNDQIDELKGKAEQAFFSAGAALADTLIPALETLVDVVTNVLSWFGNLDGGTQAFILTVLGLVAAISPIAGIISTITGLAAALNVAMLPMIGTIALIVAGIAAAVAIGVALYKNWDTIKEKAGELWNSIKDTFEKIKNSISEKIEAAKNKVAETIDRIKGLFNFKFEWPKLPMPHFSVQGSWNPIDWLKQGVPKIDVSWYAKAMQQPMLLNNATIFGAMNGKLLGGGERGSEVVMSEAMLRQMAKGDTVINMTVNAAPGMDTRTLAKEVMNEITHATKRGEAVYG